MSCAKTFSLEITPVPPVLCPDDQADTLGPASLHCYVREIDNGTTPYYCVHETHACTTGQNVQCDVGEPGLGGVLDTYAYLLYQQKADGPGSVIPGVDTILNAGKNWPINYFQAMDIYIVAGTGYGSYSAVVSNTATELRCWPFWPATAIDSTTIYAIVVDTDDDSGAGVNSQIIFAIPWDDDWTWEGTTWGVGGTGDIVMEFTCT